MFAPFTLTEWRRAVVFLTLVEVAFFGTGNLASLNSFNPSFIRNFISTFSPFVMTALLVMKIVLPLFVLSCTFCLILDVDRKQLLARLAVLLFIITDTMAMVGLKGTLLISYRSSSTS
jgi:phosphatidylinositol glycan class N